MSVSMKDLQTSFPGSRTSRGTRGTSSGASFADRAQRAALALQQGDETTDLQLSAASQQDNETTDLPLSAASQQGDELPATGSDPDAARAVNLLLSSAHRAPEPPNHALALRTTTIQHEDGTLRTHTEVSVPVAHEDSKPLEHSKLPAQQQLGELYQLLSLIASPVTSMLPTGPLGKRVALAVALIVLTLVGVQIFGFGQPSAETLLLREKLSSMQRDLDAAQRSSGTQSMAYNETDAYQFHRKRIDELTNQTVADAKRVNTLTTDLLAAAMRAATVETTQQLADTHKEAAEKHQLATQVAKEELTKVTERLASAKGETELRVKTEEARQAQTVRTQRMNIQRLQEEIVKLNEKLNPPTTWYGNLYNRVASSNLVHYSSMLCHAAILKLYALRFARKGLPTQGFNLVMAFMKQGAGSSWFTPTTMVAMLLGSILAGGLVVLSYF
jgi:hypothetical protein